MSESKSSSVIWFITFIAVAAVAAIVWMNRFQESKEAPTDIVFIANGSDHFWEIAAAGARDSARRLDANIQVMMPKQGLEDQNKFIKDLMGKDVAGVAISPIAPSKQTALLNELAKDTLLVTHDSDAPLANRLCYIGMDNYTAGQESARLVMEAMPEGGSVMLFIGSLDQDNARLRRQGFIDTLLHRPENPTAFDAPDQILKSEQYTVLGTMTDDQDMAVAKANVEKALADHPDLGCMVGMFGYSSPICLEVLKAAGKNGEVKLIAFDEHEDTLQGILDGDIHATLVQDPYQFGFQSVRILVRKARGDDTVLPLSGSLYFRVWPVRKDDVDEFKAKMVRQMASGTE